MDDDQHFQVSVTYSIKAKDRTAAAMKAYALGMPLTFSVKDAAGVAKDIRIDPNQTVDNTAEKKAVYGFLDGHRMTPGTLELVSTGSGRSSVVEHYGYRIDRRGDFLTNDAVPAGFKNRVARFNGGWGLWDPADDEDGFLLVRDSPDELTASATAHFGW